MVTMVSLTSLLPGSALVTVPGAEDLPGRRGAGSSPNPESREPRDVRQPAGVPGSLSEWAFALDGSGEARQVPRNREKGRCKSEAPLETSIHEAARKRTFIVLRSSAPCAR